MRYSVDTYRLYQSEKLFSHAVRTHVRMKEPVDIGILRHAVNTAMRRYPYFAVKVSVDADGGYVLNPNEKEVIVMPTVKGLPRLGSSRVNEHLLFVDCEGKDIYFNISHTMCGGKGILPWVMTNLYQYISEKYGIEPAAPAIRKVDSPLLPGEADEPTMERLTTEQPIYRRKRVKAPILVGDYIKGLAIPWKRNPNYWVIEVNQSDLMRVAKKNDSSVLSFFMIEFARVLDRFLPAKSKTIVGEAAHNPRESVGLPNTHCDFLSHVYIDFDRDHLKGDLEKLGTMARGQIILQTDPSVSHEQVRSLFSLYEETDRQPGLKAKRDYMAKHSLSTGKDAQHGSFVLNYTGQMDWGEVANYVDWYAFVIEGHYTIEISAMADKVFISLMQLIKTERYVKAFREELGRLGIPCRIEGSYPKRLPKHEGPVK